MICTPNASPVSIGGALKLFYWLALKTNIILERIFSSQFLPGRF
jgi:hypothetical protein